MTRRALGILAVAFVLLAACSQGAKSGPTVQIGSANFTESKILGEIYKQGLSAKGYTTTLRALTSREVYFPALEKGSVNFFPEYTGSTLNYLTKQADASKPSADENYRLLQAQLKKVNLTALDMAAASDQDGIVVNKQTADTYHLKTISDMKPVASQLVMGGPPECPARFACIKGLKQTYGITFKDFKAFDPSGPQTVLALKSNAIQVANLFTTDARIAAEHFVLLTQDHPIAGAENVVPIVRDALLSGLDQKFSDAVNAITAKLTTAGLTELNKKVDIDKLDPQDVAADWLDQQHLSS